MLLTLLPKPKIKPKNVNNKLTLPKTNLKASPHVHYAYLTGVYFTPFFLQALLSNITGLHSLTKNENINAKPDNIPQIYIEWTNVILLPSTGSDEYQPAAGAMKALITVPNKPPMKYETLFIAEAYDLNLGDIEALNIEKPNGYDIPAKPYIALIIYK